MSDQSGKAIKLNESKRQPISKKTRFEVFKRDGFVCVYCGSRPPQVVLHVDHIIAVASGGGNEIDNLATACESCNGGKGARDLTSLPLTVEEKAELLREREEQIVEFNKLVAAKHERIEETTWVIADALINGASENGINRGWYLSIRRFVEMLPFDELMNAVQVAEFRMRYSDSKRFRYFCGVCWRKIRRARGEEIDPEEDAQ